MRHFSLPFSSLKIQNEINYTPIFNVAYIPRTFFSDLKILRSCWNYCFTTTMLCIYIYILNKKRHRKKNRKNIYSIWQVGKTTYVIILYDKYIVEGLKAGRIYFPSKLLSDIFRQNKNIRGGNLIEEKTKNKVDKR